MTVIGMRPSLDAFLKNYRSSGGSVVFEGPFWAVEVCFQDGMAKSFGELAFAEPLYSPPSNNEAS